MLLGLIAYAYYEHHKFDPADWFELPSPGSPPTAQIAFSTYAPVESGAVVADSRAIVEHVGYDGKWGYFVLMRLPDSSWMARYHLGSVRAIPGEIVIESNEIGLVGCTGSSCTNPAIYTTGGNYLTPPEFVSAK